MQVPDQETKSMMMENEEAKKIEVADESTKTSTVEGKSTTTALKAAVDLIDSLLVNDESTDDTAIKEGSTTDCEETHESDLLNTPTEAVCDTAKDIETTTLDEDPSNHNDSLTTTKEEDQTESMDMEHTEMVHYTEKLLEASNKIKEQYTEKMQAASVLLDKMIESSPFQESPTAIKKAGYMSSIQNLLDVKSSEDGAQYLKTTVVDLLHEVEVLKVTLEEARSESTALKEEVISSKKRDRQQIDSLVLALTKASRGEGAGKITQEQAETLSAEQATAMTIATLTGKIEQLCSKNTELTEQNRTLLETIDDLECESAVKDVKIKALESQFKSINKTRQKVVNQSLQQLEAIASMKDMNNKENQSTSSPSSSLSQSAFLRLSTNLSPASSPSH